MNPATCNPPASAGGARRRTREVALLKGASGSCRRGLHCQCSCRTYQRMLNGDRPRVIGGYSPPRGNRRPSMSSSVSSVILRTKQAMDRGKKLRQRITAAEKLLTLAVKRLLMGDPLSLLKRQFFKIITGMKPQSKLWKQIRKLAAGY